NSQLIGNYFIGSALHETAENLQFTARQLVFVERGRRSVEGTDFAHDQTGKRGREHLFTEHHKMQRFQQGLIGDVLDQIPVGASGESCGQALVAHDLSEYHKSCVGQQSAQQRYIPIEIVRTSRRIDKHQCGLCLEAGIAQDGSVGGFTDNFKASFCQELLQALSEQLVWIYQESCDGFLHNNPPAQSGSVYFL